VPAKEKLDYIRIEGEDETGSPIVAPRLEMKYSVRIGFLDKISKNSIIGISALIVGIITIALSQPLGIPSLIPIGAALGDLGAAIIGRAHS